MGWMDAINSVISSVAPYFSAVGVGPGGGVYNSSLGPAGGGATPPAPAPAMTASATPPASLIPDPSQQITQLTGGGAGPQATAPIAAPSGAPPSTSPGLIQAAIAQLTKNPAEAANIWQAYQRYQQQQNLQNPAWVAQQAGKLNQGLSKPLVNRITNETDAAMAERGLGGAPGVYKEALAEGLAPYQYQAQQDALREFLASQQEGMGAYPMGGPLGDFSQFLSQYKLQQGAQP